MIHDAIEGFTDALAPMSALAGLDLGTRTIGVAVSDRFRSVATPLETVKRKKFGLDAAQLIKILEAREIGGIILGLPRNMDGSEGPRCQSTRAFARNFSALWPGPIGFWDERLSTVAAEKALLEADTTRKRRSEVIDHVAAAYILQGALDRMRHLGKPDPGPKRGMMKDDIWHRDEIESPCVKVCVIHPQERLCTGCLRTAREITLWSNMSQDERREVMDDLANRSGRLRKRRGGRAARLKRQD